METAKLIWEIVKWAGEAAMAFINGDDGPEPKRLAEVLPPKLKADLEHARQRRLLEAELLEDLDEDSVDDEDGVDA